MNAVDYSDIQGLLRFGFGKMPIARYLLVRVREAAAARAWLASAPVSTAEAKSPPPTRALQIALTASGLRALGVPGHVCDSFSPEFQAGMAGDESRSRRLGDVDENAPTMWAWGGSGSSFDAAVMLFATDSGMESWTREICGDNWGAAFELVHTLATTSDLDGREPFGFIDGISQPELDWKRERDPSEAELQYTNRVALGEFLLGYPNEYGKYTDRPLLELAEEGASVLALAENDPGKRDLGLNGSYLVFRQLAQDVRGFWQFIEGTAQSPEERTRVAEAMVGRRLQDGAPLAPFSSRPVDGVYPDEENNQFTYSGDPSGTRCPFGAHIRRVNPRNADLPEGSSGLLSRLWAMLGGSSDSFHHDLIASTRFHRILRRGREYGSELSPKEAARSLDDGQPRGLHFLCLNANIARQFEFVQNAWVVSGKFDGLPDESDPLLGSAGGTFSIPREGFCPRTINGIPQFVSVRGGAYFFLPSLRALRYIARAEAL